MKKFFDLFKYIRAVKNNKKKLADSRIGENPNPHGIQYDWIYRLYTVLNLPFEDTENIEKYGYYYIDNMVRKHVAGINDFLFELGLLEYVVLDTENIQQIDQFNVRIVLKFKYLNLKFWARFFIFVPMLILLIAILILLIFI